MIAAADRRSVMAPSVLFEARHVGFIADVATPDLGITDEVVGDGELPALAVRVVRTPTDPSGRLASCPYDLRLLGTGPPTEDTR
jgi:hypothetical protein